MPSPGLIARITRARRSLEKLKIIARTPWERYRVDEDLQALAERHLHIVLEAVLDLAAFIVARKGLSKGPSYRDVVRAVISGNMIPRDYAGLLLAVPGMRNILVHGYAEVRHDIIYGVLQGELSSLGELLRILWEEAEALDP